MAGTEASQAQVYVIDQENKLELRPIKTAGHLTSHGRVVIDQGLSVGDRVVTAGTAFLNAGQQVVVHVPQTVLKGAKS
jgi:multidrug efflux pump subunit AcrA (membrane-fusion protein)